LFLGTLPQERLPPKAVIAQIGGKVLPPRSVSVQVDGLVDDVGG
jgi:hypothetical protein